VVCGLLVAEDDPVEPFVVLELAEHLESQTVSVELDHRSQVIGEADDAEVGYAQVSGLVHCFAA